MKNSRTTSIISCFGIIGLCIAVLLCVQNSITRYYIRQSLNALICTRLILILLFVFYMLMGINTFLVSISIIVFTYTIMIYMQIIKSSIKLNTRCIWGLIEFF